MIKRKNNIFLITFIIFCLFSASVYSQSEESLYKQGIRAARRKNLDAAFFNFNRLINFFPDTRHLEEVLFSLGEYYFLIGDLIDAKRMFIDLLKEFPQTETKLFVLAYIFKIAENYQDKKIMNYVKRELVALRQVSLIFREYEELQHRSVFSFNYKALYYIDKIEVYIDGELLAQINF